MRVYSPQGAVVYWFYTSCGCQTVPGKVAAATGKTTFRLVKDARVKGTYTFKLHPGGGVVVEAAATGLDSMGEDRVVTRMKVEF